MGWLIEHVFYWIGDLVRRLERAYRNGREGNDFDYFR